MYLTGIHGDVTLSNMRLLIAALTLATLPMASNAMVIIQAQQVGNDVVLTGSGSLNITGATGQNSTLSLADARINPSTSALRPVASPAGTNTSYLFASTNPSYGSGGLSFPDSVNVTDDWVAINGSRVYVPFGYSSGDPINFTMTFNNTDIATLGLDQVNKYTWTITGSGDAIIVSAIPEPSTYIAIGGFAALGLFIWRRRRIKQKAATTKAIA